MNALHRTMVGDFRAEFHRLAADLSYTARTWADAERKGNVRVATATWDALLMQSQRLRESLAAWSVLGIDLRSNVSLLTSLRTEVVELVFAAAAAGREVCLGVAVSADVASRLRVAAGLV